MKEKFILYHLNHCWMLVNTHDHEHFCNVKMYSVKLNALLRDVSRSPHFFVIIGSIDALRKWPAAQQR